MQGSAPAPIDTTPQSARLRKLRATVENALRNEMATTAVWYADKLVTLSRGNVEDVLLLARSFYASGDHARAARALETRKAYGSARQPAAQFERGVTAASAAPELRARLLAARCLAKCGRHADCVATLEPALSAVEAFDSGELAGPPAPGDPAQPGPGRAFARLGLSLVPIVAAYHVAHYIPVVLVQGQYLWAALGDPLDLGWAPTGFASDQVTTSFFNHVDDVRPIWLAQAAAIVAGHVVGVFVAHAAALDLFGSARRAARSQIPLAGFMVLATLLGLWLLAAPKGA